VPRVTIKSGGRTPDGREELISECFCDWPGCLNVAEHSLGVISDIGLSASVCGEHMKQIRRQSKDREDDR
jgi:hypothetical protein